MSAGALKSNFGVRKGRSQKVACTVLKRNIPGLKIAFTVRKSDFGVLKGAKRALEYPQNPKVALTLIKSIFVVEKSTSRCQKLVEELLKCCLKKLHKTR